MVHWTGLHLVAQDLHHQGKLKCSAVRAALPRPRTFHVRSIVPANGRLTHQVAMSVRHVEPLLAGIDAVGITDNDQNVDGKSAGDPVDAERGVNGLDDRLATATNRGPRAGEQSDQACHDGVFAGRIRCATIEIILPGGATWAGSVQLVRDVALQASSLPVEDDEPQKPARPR